MKHGFLRYLLPLAMLFAAQSQLAGPLARAAEMARKHASSCAHCGATCDHCQLVECVVMVPMDVTETRLETRIVKTTEPREETYTVFQRVPVTRKITKDKCYLADEIKTKTITQKKCMTVMNPVVKTYSVSVPKTEIRHGIEKKTICTESGPVCIEEPYTRPVTVEATEIRSETCQVPDVVFETCSKEISYHVKVPKVQTVVCGEETVYKLVPVEKTRTVEVCVPKVVQHPVDVVVRKHFPKTIYCCQRCSKKHRK